MTAYLSKAVYSILRALISLLYQNGMAFGEFSRLAKLAYIEVIEQELIESSQKATTSQIAISSGLTRKEVGSLRKELPFQQKNKGGEVHNRAARVISAWVSDPDFCNDKGEANVLNIQGDNATFEKLVNLYSGDMPYRAMIKELQRIGATEIVDNNKLSLIRAAYIPSDDDDRKYDLLGEDVSLLISTIKHNITNKNDKPRYQRKVSFDKIPIECLDEFRELAEKENQTLLVKLNNWLAKHDMNKQNTRNQESMRVGVGAYYFETQSKKTKVTNDEN